MTATREDFEAWFLAYRKSTWRPAKSDPRKDMPAHWNTFCEMDCLRGWQAATAAERERCALVSEKLTNHRRIVLGAINGTKPTECEIAAAIRQGGDA